MKSAKDRTIFDRLVESLKQAGKIHRAEMLPSRRFEVNPRSAAASRPDSRPLTEAQQLEAMMQHPASALETIWDNNSDAIYDKKNPSRPPRKPRR